MAIARAHSSPQNNSRSDRSPPSPCPPSSSESPALDGRRRPAPPRGSAPPARCSARSAGACASDARLHRRHRLRRVRTRGPARPAAAACASRRRCGGRGRGRRGGGAAAAGFARPAFAIPFTDSACDLDEGGQLLEEVPLLREERRRRRPGRHRSRPHGGGRPDRGLGPRVLHDLARPPLARSSMISSAWRDVSARSGAPIDGAPGSPSPTATAGSRRRASSSTR